MLTSTAVSLTALLSLILLSIPFSDGNLLSLRCFGKSATCYYVTKAASPFCTMPGSHAATISSLDELKFIQENFQISEKVYLKSFFRSLRSGGDHCLALNNGALQGFECSNSNLRMPTLCQVPQTFRMDKSSYCSESGVNDTMNCYYINTEDGPPICPRGGSPMVISTNEDFEKAVKQIIPHLMTNSDAMLYGFERKDVYIGGIAKYETPRPDWPKTNVASFQKFTNAEAKNKCLYFSLAKRYKEISPLACRHDRQYTLCVIQLKEHPKSSCGYNGCFMLVNSPKWHYKRDLATIHSLKDLNILTSLLKKQKNAQEFTEVRGFSHHFIATNFRALLDREKLPKYIKWSPKKPLDLRDDLLVFDKQCQITSARYYDELNYLCSYWSYNRSPRSVTHYCHLETCFFVSTKDNCDQEPLAYIHTFDDESEYKAVAHAVCNEMSEMHHNNAKLVAFNGFDSHEAFFYLDRLLKRGMVPEYLNVLPQEIVDESSGRFCFGFARDLNFRLTNNFDCNGDDRAHFIEWKKKGQCVGSKCFYVSASPTCEDEYAEMATIDTKEEMQFLQSKEMITEYKKFTGLIKISGFQRFTGRIDWVVLKPNLPSHIQWTKIANRIYNFCVYIDAKGMVQDGRCDRTVTAYLCQF